MVTSVPKFTVTFSPGSMRLIFISEDMAGVVHVPTVMNEVISIHPGNKCNVKLHTCPKKFSIGMWCAINNKTNCSFKFFFFERRICLIVDAYSKTTICHFCVLLNKAWLWTYMYEFTEIN